MMNEMLPDVFLKIADTGQNFGKIEIVLQLHWDTLVGPSVCCYSLALSPHQDPQWKIQQVSLCLARIVGPWFRCTPFVPRVVLR